jgi:hypothetical protein
MCIQRETWEKARQSLVFSPVSKPHTHITYMLRQCTSIVYRLVKWLDEREIIKNEQNGFMKGRSTVDHINTITSIIETRKKCKLSTYVAFIDFKKAYDSINRALLFNMKSARP